MLQSNNGFRMHRKKNANTKDRTERCWKLMASGLLVVVTCYQLIWNAFMKNNKFLAYFCFYFSATDLLHSLMRIWWFTAKNCFWWNWNICMKLLLFFFVFVWIWSGGKDTETEPTLKTFCLSFFSFCVVVSMVAWALLRFWVYFVHKKEIPILIMFSEVSLENMLGYCCWAWITLR